jgi:hypothetical protein
MKLQLEKIVEVLISIKKDDFYFRSYAAQIISSYNLEYIESFNEWCEKNQEKIKNISIRQKINLYEETIKKNLED